jgi:SAM-dependent methyltransferase
MYCPLCASTSRQLFHEDQRRSYLRCDSCALVYVPVAYHLDAAAERAEYDLHQNAVHDPGYRRFLMRLAAPLLERLPEGAKGLDFGCGPGPALAHMLQGAGFDIRLYDIFYYPDESVLRDHYDFICATEVVEHLHRPGEELARLWALLRPGGWLGVMTKLVRDREAFAGWHYKNDPTHVCFFSRQTWQWWGLQMGVQPEFLGTDVILLRKPPAQSSCSSILA